jgi:hypothetical protein
MPTFIAVQCPHCHRDQVVKRGKTARGTQRYLCQNRECTADSFLLDYCNRGLSLLKTTSGSSAVEWSRLARPETRFHMPHHPVYPFERVRENGRYRRQSRFLAKCWAKTTWD